MMKAESTEMEAGAGDLGSGRICFVGRGGAGKSTCLALMAKLLATRGYEVCVLDADSTNLGLHKALGINRSPEPLIGYYGGMVFQGGAVGCLVDDPSLLTDPEIDLDQLPLPYQATNGRGYTAEAGQPFSLSISRLDWRTPLAGR